MMRRLHGDPCISCGVPIVLGLNSRWDAEPHECDPMNEMEYQGWNDPEFQ